MTDLNLQEQPDGVKCLASFDFAQGVSVILCGDVAVAVRTTELLLPHSHAVSRTCP